MAIRDTDPDQTAELPAGAPSFGYSRALDGIRACAVAAVVLFHAGVTGLGGGFLGVDTFFVLSGFLITSLLLAERARTGRIALGRFWVHRARRLLPALLTMLVATVAVGHLRLDDDALHLLRGDSYAALGYVANWRMIFRGTGYAAVTAAPSPLQHTWSLGIEEQFYLLWPLLVAGLLTWLPARRARAVLLACCLLGAVASELACRALFQPDAMSRAYYGTDTRAQALLIGAALATLLAPARRAAQGWHRFRGWPGPASAPGRTDARGPAGVQRRPGAHELPGWRAAQGRRAALAWHTAWRWHTARGRRAVLGGSAAVAAAATLWLWHGADDQAGWMYRGGLSAAALATAIIIAHAVTSPRSVLARFLSLAPLVWLGRISYGVYLWHWPLFTYVTADATGLSRWPLLVVRLGGTLAVAVLSYHLIEQPIRHGALARLLPRGIPAATATATLGVVILAIGFATAPPAHRAVAAAPVVAVTTGKARPRAPINRPGRPRRAGREPRVTFFGDSVSWVIGTYLPRHPGMWTSVRAIQGCGIATLPDILMLGTPHTNYPGCTSWQQRWQRGVDRDNPDVAVVELNRWELMDRRYQGSYQHVGEPAYDAYLTAQLDAAVHIAASRGAAVVLLTAAYTHRAERPDGGLYPEDQPDRVDAWNRLVHAEAARRPGTVTVLDVRPLVCPGGRFAWDIDGARVRSDGLHYTPYAVQNIIAPWLLPRLAAIAAGTYRAG
ncbi:acyltransferase family protein [Krasilnikovia sp. MM14-A1259]|uniref:acyltransferase family protein n=1 Tax=Krasilnikovia sp. MM14-A1259 TaxID=3373539 RepID=UPI003830D011